MNDTDAMKDNQDRYTVPGLERGLLLLCEFSRQNRTLTAPSWPAAWHCRARPSSAC